MGKLNTGHQGEGQIFNVYSLKWHIMQLNYFSSHQRLCAGAVPATKRDTALNCYIRAQPSLLSSGGRILKTWTSRCSPYIRNLLNKTSLHVLCAVNKPPLIRPRLYVCGWEVWFWLSSLTFHHTQLRTTEQQRWTSTHARIRPSEKQPNVQAHTHTHIYAAGCPPYRLGLCLDSLIL